jgi:alpha-tubulin suppressor-like RCC1 family protein
MANAPVPGSMRRWHARALKASAVLAAVAAGALGWPAGASAQSRHTPADQPPIQSGLALAWGNNSTGQLGQGNHKNSPVPLRVARLGGPVAAISAGTDGSMALTRMGQVWAWGGNDQGQLGTGDQQWHSAPTPVKGPDGKGRLSGITAIVSANVASAALGAQGTVFTWGNNIWGQLGNGTVQGPDHCPTAQSEPPGPADVCSTLPVPVVSATGAGKLSHIVAIAGSTDDDLALGADGTVWTWGINVAGELGTGTNSGPRRCKPYSHFAAVGCSTRPVQVVGPGGKGVLSNVVAVAGGADFEVALRADGTVWAWGSDAFADLGQTAPAPQRCYDPFDYGDIPCSPVPLEVSGPGGVGHLTHIVAISAEPSPYGLHVLALRSDGTVWAWGIDDYGQLGNGKSEEFDNLPSEVVGPDGKGYLQGAVAIAAGGGFSMARLANGSIWTWGENNFGQLGIGSDTGPSLCTTENTPCSVVPVQVKGPGGAGVFGRSVQISAAQLDATALQGP